MQLNETIRVSVNESGLTDREIANALWASLPDDFKRLKKVLLVPPDATRAHSGAGMLTRMYYHLLHGGCQVDILPALGTHVPMSEDAAAAMFGDIPYKRFLTHNWRTDVVKIGTADAKTVRAISGGITDQQIDFEISKHLLDPSYDLIISIGQVVPHEVVGMANYTKNILVGCGGCGIINASHMLGAFYGLERLMGRDHGPVRALFDYAEENFLKARPLSYVLTVTTAIRDKVSIRGLFIGRERRVFEQAVALSQKRNIVMVEKPLSKVVVWLDPDEFKSTWLGNKAVYRTRMAIANGGELIILAPGVERFGEDGDIDLLIRKYGYRGREHIIECCGQNDDLSRNLSAAAHLIHGSSDGRFSITYCTRHLPEADVRDAGFNWMRFEDAVRLFNPEVMKDGFNTVGGEEIFFISNPAVGLWADRQKFDPV